VPKYISNDFGFNPKQQKKIVIC